MGRTGNALDVFEGTVAYDVELPAGRIRYYRAGHSGPPIVLLHGGVLDSSELAYGKVVPLLAERFRVYALDWPEHGHSWPWADGTSEVTLCDVLQRMLHIWDLDRAALVGASQGGGIATRFALDHPERVDRVVAIGPVGFEDRAWVLGLMDAVARVPAVPRLATRLLARFPRLVDLSMRLARVDGKDGEGFRDSVAIGHEQAVRAVQHGATIIDDYLYQTYTRSLACLSYLPEVHRLTVPTLIVQGSRDLSTSRRALIRAATRMPKGEYRRVMGVGHLSCRDDPETMARVIIEFLA